MAPNPMTKATDSIADGANSALASASSEPKTAPPARRGRGRVARVLGWVLAALLALLLAGLGGLWWWTGSEGSLATALRWAGALQPLVTDDVTGSLRRGGQVRRAVWDQAGLRIEVHDAELRWTPAALLGGRLQIDQLAASRILIDDQRAPSAPSAGPPPSLALPLGLQVKALRAGELRWAGPPSYTLSDIAGRFDYDGARHLLALDSARIEGGHYRLQAAATAHAPIRVDLALAGALTAPVPGADAPMPLTLQATLRGPLTEMAAQAELQAAPPATGASAPALPALPALAGFASIPALPAPPSPPAAAAAPPAADTAAEQPEAQASARITPWAAQPLPEAHARLRALDLGALWAAAPRTRLSGQLDLAALPAGASGQSGWALVADLSNRAAGPWDQRQLPVEQLRADLTWQDGVAQVRSLQAQLGGGTLESNGRWAAPPAASASATATGGSWQVDTQLAGINPARLHTRLAAFPLDGTARVSGAGAAIDFDIALQARPQRAAAPARQGEAAAEALARELRALRLQAASAQGRWADGLLTLGALRVRTDEAELSGSARLRPASDALGGSADLTLTAPGASASLQGELQPASGAGTLRARIQDAARTLAWAQKLPGAADALAGARARGAATLDGSWRGGWRDPTLQGRLGAAALDWAGPGSAADAPPLQLRAVDLSASGRLAQLQLAASGRLLQGPRQLELRLTASGGRSTPKLPLAASDWRLRIDQLQAGVRDPALGDGSWQLATRGAVPFSWSPAQGGQFEVGAGELTINSPPPPSSAQLAWNPLRWRAGELTTTGRLTGLPLQWVERIAGSQLQDAGLTGNIVFNGDWDATLGAQLRVSANLVRASGDITVLATDAQTGVQSRVAAGLRDARLTLRSDGNALQLALRWDSEQAGSVDGRLRTELAAARDTEGRTRWSWPDSAPLTGRLQAQLPQIAAWSVLAPPGWRLHGALAADAQLTGTRGAPRVTGSLTADEVALRSVVDGLQFEGGRLRARLDGTRLLIDEFSLRGAGDAGGSLRASGEAGLLDGRPQARLEATLNRLRASIRDDRQVTTSGRLTATLDGRRLGARGQLRVDQALIVLPDESRPSLGDDVIVRGPDGKIMYGQQAPGTVARPTSAAGQQAAQQAAHSEAVRAAADARARASEAGPLTADVDLQVDLGDEFRLRGMGLDTRLAGALTLTAQGALTELPRLRGRVRTEGGSFRAYGQQLVIQHGLINFSGQISNLSLDIVALRPNHASDQRVGVQVAGTALLPRVRLYSAPALPDNQTLAWLLLGRAAPDTGAESALLQSAALALLGGREGRGLAANVGLDEFSFSGNGNGDLANASLTLGKRLSDGLYAAYEHSLAGTGGTLLIFYELSRRWTLRGSAGANQAVDLIYRLSFD